MQGAPAFRGAAAAGEGAAERAGRGGQHHQIARHGAEADQRGRFGRGRPGEGEQRVAYVDVLLGDLDRDVQDQEAEGGGAEGPVHPLGQQPAARQEDCTACGDQPPDDGGREGYEGQHAAGEVEEGA
ncbi:hypothetical protein ADK78_23015 [Kitasatospora aureofaciens]|nr:hypothetical protein ADK78_23015 [Kitasatospora aureofaciens]